MARRQNHRIARKFVMPEQIGDTIAGINKDGNEFINLLLRMQHFAHLLFDGEAMHHEDWVLFFTILANMAEGKATVTKNIAETSGRTHATVRVSLARFEQAGLIVATQKIGRSELFQPTAKLKKIINKFAPEFLHQARQKDMR